LVRGILISLLGHGVLLVGLLWLGVHTGVLGPTFIAAGPGEGPGGKAVLGNAIEVGLVSASEFLRFRPEPAVATLGDETHGRPAIEDVQQKIEDADAAAEPIPGRRFEPEKKEGKSTERPVSSSPEKPYTVERGAAASASTSAVIGRPGSPTPGRVTGGIGLEDVGGGGGIPGGSEYGRRLQQALISYYRLIPRETTQPRYVIVRVRIARSGEILSIQNGRLDPEAFVQPSGNLVIDSRVTGALLELNRNPIPFPLDFLAGRREAVAEIYFQYE